VNILDEIILHKKQEVKSIQAISPVKSLKNGMFFNAPARSLKNALLEHPDGCGIIAEFKRKSPSKGIINRTADVRQVTMGYTDAGAAALSVLTDNHFFCGMLDDLYTARRYNSIPVLRKDFIFSEYQVIEAKAFGADAILLIAAVLDKETIRSLTRLAHNVNLEVLLEIHNEKELHKICEEVDIVGVNNRDLKSFTVDIERSVNLAKQIPGNFTKISESGINDAKNILKLKDHGYKGFLIGEYFMKHESPAKKCAGLIKGLKRNKLYI